MDRNINGFTLPAHVKSNDEYEKELGSWLKRYVAALRRPPFMYDEKFINDVSDICNSLIGIFGFLRKNNKSDAKTELKALLQRLTLDEFFVSELDKCYSFRGVAPFPELYSGGADPVYERMRAENLTFFRARTKVHSSCKDISQYKHIVHLPYSLRNQSSETRFCRKGEACLYLGTTTFVCAKECRWNENESDLYASAFIPNEKGKKLKILNLTVSQALINGNSNDKNSEALQKKLLTVFPVVIATSFEIDDDPGRERLEYYISQLLMETLHEEGIDGISYLSMQGKDDFQYPQGVNLALPAYDISATKEYSEYCDCFMMTLPKKMGNSPETYKQSYINKIYRKYLMENIESFTAKVDINGKDVFYGDTRYGRFDDYLVSQEFAPWSFG